MTEPATLQPVDSNNANDMDPGVADLLDRKAARTAAISEYRPRSTAEVKSKLHDFFTTEMPDHAVSDVRRMGGGASKEQFQFSLTTDHSSTHYVLRMDPVQTAAETDRRREFEVLNAYSAHVPAPTADWIDEHGKNFGQPSAIMRFVSGVTKPSTKTSGPNVTGLGTFFPADLRDSLGPQFIGTLSEIHRVDVSEQDIPSFAVPRPGTEQAALWQLNWMSRVWHDDHVHPSVLSAVTERWLRQNLPTCERPVMVHGDYRTGNFLFDEESSRITAILDWEWAHVGDFHEDLAWIIQELYTTKEDGREYVCGLVERDRLIELYQEHSGNTVNFQTLRWYEIYCAYKSYVITLATSIRAARDSASHQDVMLSWLAPAGYRFSTPLCRMISEEIAQ